MALAAEDINYIKANLAGWLAEQSFAKPPVVYEIELRERMVRVEEELKHQRALIEQILLQMDKRFASMEKHQAELREDMNKRQDELREDMNKRFEAMDKRFEAMDKRFEAVDKRFEDMSKRFEAVDKRFEDMNKRFEAMDKRFDFMNKRFDRLENRLERYLLWSLGLFLSFAVALLLKTWT